MSARLGFRREAPRRLAALLLAAAGAAAAAGIDVNRASQAQLETVKGIGPELSTSILDERARRPFSDWSDLVSRVPGIGAANAPRLSAAGLTVGGAAYAPAPAKEQEAARRGRPRPAAGAASAGR